METALIDPHNQTMAGTTAMLTTEGMQ